MFGYLVHVPHLHFVVKSSDVEWLGSVRQLACQHGVHVHTANKQKGAKKSLE